METGVEGGVWLTSLVAVPLTAAIFAFLYPAWGGRLTLLTGILMTLSALAVCRITLAQGVWTYAIGGWAAPLGIGWQVDGPNALMVLMAAIVSLAGGGYGLGYFSPAQGPPPRNPFFWPLWLFLWAALNTLFLSADLFNIYIALELMTLAAVTLIALAGSRAALRAAMRYLLAALLGSLLYLLGMTLIYGALGVLDLAAITESLEANLATRLGVTAITLGLLLKGAVFPLHFWLPAAHGYAPTPVSAILSAVVVAASLYLLLRLWFGPFTLLLSPGGTIVLGLLGAAAIIWGALQALQQQRLKMVIAYSTVSQLGYGMLAFPLFHGGKVPDLAWAGTFLLIFAHGLAKAALFFASGCIASYLGHDRIRELTGGPPPLLGAWLAFALASASLIGLPPSGGFSGKWLLLQAAIANQGWGWAAMIIAGSILAAGYLFRVLGRALFPSSHPQTPLHTALPSTMLAMSLGLALAAFFLGFLLTPLRDLTTISDNLIAIPNAS